MKKWLLKAGMCAAGVFLMGAVAVSTVDKLLLEPLTVESSGGLVEKYIKFREQIGPIVPPGVMYSDVAERISKGDWSFLKESWFFTFDNGVLYVPETSALAKELTLPARIQMREDLTTGEIYIFSAPVTDEGTGTFSGLAVFKAPEFLPYEKDFPLDRFLSDELSPRRIVWEVTLKPEADAWADLIFQRDTSVASATLLDGGGMMSMMMVPEEHTNDLWLCLEPQIESGINLNIFAPEGFTNRVEIYSCTDLISNAWEIEVQNLYPVSTNPAVWDATSLLTNQFFRAGNMDIDSDGDGLPDAREQIVYKTNPENTNTDGDGYTDDWEVAHGMDPLSASLNPQEDTDSDGYLNIYEYANGGDPANSNSIPTATRYVSLAGSHTPPFVSWATASTNIQTALTAATNDYEIIAVADGTYTEFMNHVLVFPTNAVMLTGTSSASNCVLDGKMFEGGQYSGLEISSQSVSSNWTVLLNITLKNGRNNSGVFVFDSSRVIIDRCALLGNYGEQSEVLVKNGSSLILKTTAINSLGSFMGIEDGSTVTVKHCEVVYGEDSTGITVQDNSSLLGDSSTIRCVQWQGEYSRGVRVLDTAQAEGFILEGNETGVENSYFSASQIKNCVFIDNVSAVSVDIGAHPVVDYCTFTGNTNALLGPIWDDPEFEQTISVKNSILWDNVTAVNTSAAPLTVSVSNSCVQSGLPVDGNITNAPQFEYAWHIASNSPCRNAGMIACAPAKDADGDVREDGMPDIGADEYIDSDGDGLRDWVEINIYGTNPNKIDSDEDGMPDGWEVAHGFNPLLDDANGNPDGDGLTNVQEYTAGTDPHNSDTDGDGLPDGVDADPLVADTTLPIFTISYPTNGTTVF